MTATVLLTIALWSAGQLFLTARDYHRSESDLRAMYAIMEQAEGQCLTDAADTAGEALPAGDMCREEPTNLTDGGSGSDPAGLGAIAPEGLLSEQRTAEVPAFQTAVSYAARLGDDSAAVPALREVNPDTLCYLEIPGTIISYPVLYSPDRPGFYLKHGFDGRPSAYGMIYAEETCGALPGAKNIVLCGHHMKNGSMFGSLETLVLGESGEGHRRIAFGAPENPAYYEIFAVLRLTEAEAAGNLSAVLAASDEKAYRALLSYVQDKNLLKDTKMPVWPARLLTLVTCEYTRKNGRLLVLAMQPADGSDP